MLFFKMRRGERNPRGKARYYTKTNSWHHEEEKHMHEQTTQTARDRFHALPGKGQPRENCRAAFLTGWGLKHNLATLPQKDHLIPHV